MLYSKIAAAALLLSSQTTDAFHIAVGPAAVVVTPFGASTIAASRAASIEMGRGDKRTKKGKRKAGSFGNSRLRNAEIRKRRDGPGADLGMARAPVILEEPAAAAMPEPIEEAPPLEAVVEE